jgi:hypothetical protein
MRKVFPSLLGVFLVISAWGCNAARSCLVLLEGKPPEPDPYAHIQIYAEPPQRPFKVLGTVTAKVERNDYCLESQAEAEAMKRLKASAAEKGADAVIGLVKEFLPTEEGNIVPERYSSESESVRRAFTDQTLRNYSIFYRGKAVKFLTAIEPRQSEPQQEAPHE